MSFGRGRGGGGGFRGGRGGGGGRGGFGGGRDRRSGYDQGPPEEVTPLGRFEWTVQDDLVAKVDIEQVPFFNAPIYTENKQQIGKIDEIFGNIRDYYVSIKLTENMKASSFVKDSKVSIVLNFYQNFKFIRFFWKNFSKLLNIKIFCMIFNT